MGQEEAWASSRPSGREVDISEDSPGDLVLPLSYSFPATQRRAKEYENNMAEAGIGEGLPVTDPHQGPSLSLIGPGYRAGVRTIQGDASQESRAGSGDLVNVISTLCDWSLVCCCSFQIICLA